MTFISQEFKSKRYKVVCDNCGKTFLKYRSDINRGFRNLFCSMSCRTSFCNKRRKENGFTLKNTTKEAKCTKCNKLILIKINASTHCFVCKDCKSTDIEYTKKGGCYKKRPPKIIKPCVMCGIKFETRQRNYCNNCLKIRQQQNGLLNVQKRKEIKRSKNEILFAELCIKYFENITTNKPIFDGWDSDVQLHNYKLAIHWNGAWHYRYCGGKHSLSQVQARDKIKFSIIEKCGWTNYIIKDMGNFNDKFVKEQFEKLKLFINNW